MKLIFFFYLASAALAQPVIVWPFSDHIEVTHPVWSSQKTGETTESFLDRVISRNKTSVPHLAGVSPVVIEETSVPVDRYFRNAWKMQKDSVMPDRSKCEEIQRAKLQSRADVLVQIELKEYQEADLRGDEATKEECKKRVTSYRAAAAIDLGVEAAPTLQDLKSAMPSVLTTDK